MEKVSGMDLEVFFRQWLYHPEIPRLQVAWKYDRVQKKITISMDQIQNGDLIFDLPVEIAIYKKGSSAPTFLKIHLDKKHKTQTFKLNDAPEKLEIDPKNVLLCESSMMEMK
jgi:aminopeptidase N